MSRSTAVPARSSIAHDPWRRVGSIAAHPSRAEPSEPLVAAIARGLAQSAPPWGAGAVVGADGRSYERLLATAHYDAWLIHWPPGSGLDAHDHGGSTGAFAVVDGELHEDVVVNGAVVATRSVGEGDAVAFGPDHIHAVSNQRAVGATSVHVYSPPLGDMTFYDEVDAEARR